MTDINALIDTLNDTETKLMEAFGYRQDWRCLPISDDRDSFWRLDGNEVCWADSEDELNSQEGNSYSGALYRKIIHRTATHTAVGVDILTATGISF